MNRRLWGWDLAISTFFCSSPHGLMHIVIENNCSSRSVSSASLAVNPHYPLRVRPSLIWPIYFSSLIPHHSLPSPGPQDPGTAATGRCSSSLSLLVFAHTVLSAWTAVSPVSSCSISLHKITFPLTIRFSVLSLSETLLPPQGRLGVPPTFSWKTGTTALYSYALSAIYVQKAFANERVDWQ